MNDTGETASNVVNAADPVRASLGDVEEALRDVVDPGLGVNVVDLGLVYGLRFGEDGTLLIDMTLTTAACELTDVIGEQAARALAGIVNEWRLNWVWMPPWGPDRITDDGLDQMRAVPHDVAAPAWIRRDASEGNDHDFSHGRSRAPQRSEPARGSASL